NSNGFNESQNAVWGPEYNFGNQFVNPNLTIAKFNSQWPNIQAPGSVIDYTITVTASENNVNNVKVRDLLPKGFEYVSGSGTASSSLGGDHDGALELSHEYASPGEWNLGNMQSGEVVTLTYKAKIADNQEPGNYKDLAWADGTDDKSTRVIASSMPAPAVDPGEITDNFVGTQIEMAIAPTPQSVELEEETDTETKTKKKVLGVTTYLPATGTPNGWLMLALAIIIGGAGLMFVSRRRSKNNNLKDLSMKVMLLMIVGMGMIFSTSNNIAQAETIAPSIRLEQPVSPTNDKNLDVGFVVLDIDNRPVTVDCYKKGSSDLAAVKFNTVALPEGGSSGVCEVVLDADGNYDLYATASADGDSSDSNSVSVSLATNTPGTPTNYDRDNEGCTVTFNTANDGGLTKKVVLYRSTEAKFVADNSTKVQEGNFESNVGGSLVDPNGNCDDYFYAIQAVSEAGIGSNFVGDVDVDTETETRTRTVYDETVVYTGGGAIPVTEGQITEGATEEGGAAQEAEGEKAVQGEEVEGELVEGAESEGQVAGIFSEKNSKYWWAVGLIALLSAAYYGYRKYAQKNKKLPFDEE
ncbi:MAG: LPXTG cell wall anchor domain-containing protein, partial [Candidatus Moranbacteria bacterium]|nr:LPXTG cell wall anchor domain-containing protein [Candidatus Moranbacteria bacterium]